MTRYPALLVLLLALVASGCRGTAPLVREAPVAELPTGFPFHSVADIQASVRAASAGVTSYRADGRVSVVSPQLNQNATFSLRARLADSLTVVVRGPFGIEGARALVTTDEFVAHDRLNNVLYVGQVSAADRFVPGAGSLETLARALAGLLVPAGEASAWTVDANETTYTLTNRRPDGSQQQLVVDPAFWRVVIAREFGADGLLLAEQRFEALDTVEGVVLPRRVVLESPAEGVLLTLEHTRLTLNPPDLTLPFTRPAGVPVRPIP